MSLRAASQILNKTKNFFEIKNITWECKQQISLGGAVRKEILSSQYDSSIVFWRKKTISFPEAAIFLVSDRDRPRCPFRWTKQRGLWERDWRKKQMTLARAHNRDAVPLRYTSFLERLICNTIKRWDRATPSLPLYFSWLAVSCLLG